MKEVLDACWRAALYCLHPQVILWSLLPLLLSAGLVLGLGWLYWEGAVAAVRATLEHWALVASFLAWLDSVGLATLNALLAPLLLVAVAVPLVMVVSLLLVAWLITPPLVRLVARRRFAQLERRRGAGWWYAALRALGCTLLALLVLVLSMPLWLIPPMVMLLPPLIWGWLLYQVMSFDVLAAHASAAERRELMRAQRWPLLAIGVCAGYLGAVPSLLWAAGALSLIFAPVLLVASVWLYTLMFAFATLWFAHFGLSALQRLRAVEAVLPAPDATPLPELQPLPPPTGFGGVPPALTPPADPAGTPPARGD